MRIVGLRWLISFAGTAAIAGLVWTFGPLVPLLEAPVARLAVILAILLIWGGLNAAMDWRARQADKRLAQGVVEGAADEAAAIRDRLEAALRSLRKAQGSLHDRPWYVIIGPPGAGKTTALHNSGLRFPVGRDPVKGVGGTRYCDWWFTEDAVLIDTAGRYTTQDSDAGTDRTGWEAFLDLLRTVRPRQPLNGVIVAIPLSDVAKADAEERMAHARAIRRRVRELQTRLGLRLPIYVLFTKADLIAGFSEFFADMDTGQRAQVWGFTFDPEADESDCADLFTRGFRSLIERLNTRLFERLRDERNAARRGLIAMFPSQVASLEQPLAEFIKAAFTGYPVQLIPRVRGVYLSSATQEGTPFDRLTGELSRTFGLEQQRAARLNPEKGRSFFLESLLRDVIFNEAMLVSEPPAVQRRRKLVQATGLAAVGLAAVTVCGYTWHLRASALRQADAGTADIVAFEQTAQAVQLDPVRDADLPRVLPMLDAARAAALEHQESAQTWLSQSAKLAAGGMVLYRHALERALLPRLVWQMETTVRDNLNNPDFLYEATRVYLMLGGHGPLDIAFVHEWMRLSWQNIYPAPAYGEARERLLAHLDALLAGPLPPVPLDGQLVARARGALGKVSIAQRAYSAIRLSPAAQRIAPWRPGDSLNVAGLALFRRTSGKSLNDGVAGFYTIEGFHRVLLPSVQNAARDAVMESWVVGQRIDIDPKGPAMSALQRDVIGLYENDYAQTWDAMLADLNMAPLSSVSQAAQDLFILASPQSPIRSLLVSVARELTLSVPPGQTQRDAADAPATGAGRLETLLGSAAAATRVPGQDIDLRYAAIRELAGSGGAAPIDQALRSLNDMQQQFARAAATVGSGVLSAGADPALAVKVEALRQPEPLSRWLLALAASGSALRNGEGKR